MNPFLSIYCERAGLAGLLAEPLNALTNVAFLIAAAAIWHRLSRDPRLSFAQHWDIALLATIVFIIGLGSGAWHTWPIRATLLSDVIPITVFIHVFIAVFFVRVAGLAWYWAIGIVAIFAAASFGAPSLLSTRALGSTLAYMPAYVALVLTTASMYALKTPQRDLMFIAAAIWTPSLALRSVDGVICAYLPFGTHFLWHVLNACVLYTLLRAVTAAALERRMDLGVLTERA